MSFSVRLTHGWIAPVGLLLCSVPAFSQGQGQIVDDDGTTYNVKLIFNKRLAPGTAQLPAAQRPLTAPGSANILGGLAFYAGHYTSFGKTNPFQIVGTDPALGANTTTIPTVIVPISLTFASSGATLDGTNKTPATANSPIFLTADYTTGITDLGVTQYGDAIQRGEFWNLPGFSLNYHVLLGTPTIAPTQSYTVPVGSGNTYASGALGVVDPNWFDPILTGLAQTYAANVLPIFVTDNVFEGNGGVIQNCCVLGYHNSNSGAPATANTWIYAAYTRSGTFRNDVILDVQPLSHEVAEWLNDPFVGVFALGGLNFIPPAILPGSGGACIINFETGDPLESPPVVFTKVTNGTTYHLQDEVFLWWYLHGTSFGVNGYLTYLNSFTTPSSLCGGG